MSSTVRSALLIHRPRPANSAMQGVLHVDPEVRDGLRLGTSVISPQCNFSTRVQHHQMEAEAPKPAAIPIQTILVTYYRVVEDRNKSGRRVCAGQ